MPPCARRSLRVHDHQLLTDRQAAPRRLLCSGSRRFNEAPLAGASLSSRSAGSLAVLSATNQHSDAERVDPRDDRFIARHAVDSALFGVLFASLGLASCSNALSVRIFP